MAVTNRILNSAYTALVRRPSGNMHDIQEKVLMNMLRESAETTIGREYGFKRIKSVAEYQARVPVHHYEDMTRYWQAEMDGAVRESVRNRIHYYALTSGTTGEKKIVPVPGRVLANNRKSELYLMTLYLEKHPNSGILMKKVLGITGCAHIGMTASGAPYGMVSGIMAMTVPLLFKHGFIPDRSVVNLTDWNIKLMAYARVCKKKKIGTVLGIPTAVLDVISKIKEVYSAGDFEYFIKHLDLLCFSGVSYHPYKQAILSLLERDIEIINYYSASEGILGYQSPVDPNSLELYYDTVFFEFLTCEEYVEKKFDTRRLITELETGVSYVPLITTGNGAFSYVIGDVLHCEDNSIPIFRIEGRTKLVLNLATEKTPINAIENALNDLSHELGVSPGEFFVTAGMKKKKPHYLWVIQENETWQKQDIYWLCRRLDERLIKYNEHYKHFVNETLGPSKIVFAKEEKFKDWLEERKADMGHRKIPRIIENPESVKSFLE